MIATPPRRKAESKKKTPVGWGRRGQTAGPICDASTPRPAIPGQDRSRTTRPTGSGWQARTGTAGVAPPSCAATCGSARTRRAPWRAERHRSQLQLHPPGQPGLAAPRPRGRCTQVACGGGAAPRSPPRSFILLTGSDPVPRRCPVSVRTGPAWFSCRDLVRRRWCWQARARLTCGSAKATGAQGHTRMLPRQAGRRAREPHGWLAPERGRIWQAG